MHCEKLQRFLAMQRIPSIGGLLETKFFDLQLVVKEFQFGSVHASLFGGLMAFSPKT